MNERHLARESCYPTATGRISSPSGHARWRNGSSTSSACSRVGSVVDDCSGGETLRRGGRRRPERARAASPTRPRPTPRSRRVGGSATGRGGRLVPSGERGRRRTPPPGPSTRSRHGERRALAGREPHASRLGRAACRRSPPAREDPPGRRGRRRWDAGSRGHADGKPLRDPMFPASPRRRPRTARRTSRSGRPRDSRRRARTSRARSGSRRSRGSTCSARPGRGRFPCTRSAVRSRSAISRACVSVAGGVGGRSSIFQSGWKALKWSGTSAPSRSATQRVSASTSSSESLSPGMSSVVTSTQTSGLVHEVLERVEHRLEVAGARLRVEVLGEALQVDVRRVHVPEELLACAGADVARGDGDRLARPARDRRRRRRPRTRGRSPGRCR